MSRKSPTAPKPTRKPLADTTPVMDMNRILADYIYRFHANGGAQGTVVETHGYLARTI